MSSLLKRAKLSRLQFLLTAVALLALTLGIPLAIRSLASNPDIIQLVSVQVNGEALAYGGTCGDMPYRSGETTFEISVSVGGGVSGTWQYSTDGGVTWTTVVPVGGVLTLPTGGTVTIRFTPSNGGTPWQAVIVTREIAPSDQQAALETFTISNTGYGTLAAKKAPLGFPGLAGGGSTGPLMLKKSAVTGSYFLNISIAVDQNSEFTPEDYTYRIFSGFRLPGEFPKGGSGGSQSLPRPFSPIPDGTETFPLPVIQAPFPANGTATVELVPQYAGDGPFVVQIIPTPTQNDNGNNSETLAENTAEGYSTCSSCTSCNSPQISLQDTPVSVPLGGSGGYDPLESDGSPSPQPRHSACEADGELTFNIPTLYDPTVSEITNPGLPGIGMLAPKGAYQVTSPNADTIEIQGERKFVIEKTPVQNGDQNALTITAYAVPGNTGSKYLTLKIAKNLSSGALEIREFHGTSTTAKLHVYSKESSGATTSSVLVSHDGARQLRREFTSGGVGRPHSWSEARKESQVPSGGGAAVAIHHEMLQFRRYSGGTSRVEARTIAPGSISLTTRSYYFENGENTGPQFGGSHIGAGRLKRRESFDGHLITAQYAFGRQRTTTPYADNPSGSVEEWEGTQGAFTAVDAQLGAAGSLAGTGDKIKILRTSSVAALNGPAIPSVTGQQWGGSAVVTGKSGFASANLYRIPGDTHAPGRVSRVLDPSGRLTTVSYSLASGVMEIITESGEPNAAKTEVVKGERVTLSTMSCGRVLSEVVQGFDDLTEKSSPVYLTGRYAEPTDFDSLGRPLAIHYNSLPSEDRETFTYACCGVETHTSRRGRVTTYGYDSLGRIETTTVKRSSTGAATVFSTARTGLTVTESRNNTVVSSRTVDLAGRVVSASSADENGDGNPEITTYTYAISSNGIVTTATDPLNGTSITSTHPDGRTAAVWGTAVPDRVYRYATGILTGRTVVTQYRLQTTYGSFSGDVSGLTEWNSTAYDTEGRAVASWNAASGSQHKALWNYNATTGLLDSSSDADGVTFTYLYHPDGSLHHTIQNLPPDSQQASRNRVTTREYAYEKNDLLGGNQRGSRVERTYLQTGPNDVTGLTPVTTSWSRGDGYASKSTTISSGTNLSSSSLPTIANRASGSWTETTVNPDDTSTLTQYTDGLTSTVTVRSTTQAALHTTSYAYDSLGRVLSTTDSRTGVTSYDETGDNMADMTVSGNLTYIKDPGARVTRMVYDKLGRRKEVKLPDATIAYTAYDTAGNTRAIWGSQTYPQRYTYDEQGRLRKLETWRSNASSGDPAGFAAGDTTTWTYVAGRLYSKEDAKTRATTYAYTWAGRLQFRTWARVIPGTSTRLATEYVYTNGFLTGVNYNDATPDVSLAYDNLGRRETVTNSVASTTYQYTATDLGLDTETITYNIPGQAALTRVLDRSARSLGRDTGWELRNDADPNNPVVENSTNYTYRPTDGRIGTISGLTAAGVPGSSFDYTYENQSDLVKTVVGPAHTVTNTWDPTRDVLKTKVNEKTLSGTAIHSSFVYSVNALGQRETLDPLKDEQGNALSTYTPKWTWQYDSKGQLFSADDRNATADRFYSYDSIGNRTKSREGTSTDSGGILTSYFGTTGATPAAGANSINQYALISVGNSTGNPVFDEDGNLRLDGGINKDSKAREYFWDAENRLVEVRDVSTATPVTLVTCAYDAFSRLVARSTTAAVTGEGAGTTHYFYDGWNRIAEYSGQALTKTYLWGMDLSGTIQGAGGVGGLLAVRIHGAGAATYYPAFDGNGNITEYIDSTGGVVAHYEYDPFGNIVLSSGEKKDAFVYRFSTKPLDLVTGWFYYGYRWYDPLTGRWPSRDPIGENGGVNLYGFVGNDGVDWADVLGLDAQSNLVDRAAEQLRKAGIKEAEIALRLEIIKAALNDKVRCGDSRPESEWVEDSRTGQYMLRVECLASDSVPRLLDSKDNKVCCKKHLELIVLTGYINYFKNQGEAGKEALRIINNGMRGPGIWGLGGPFSPIFDRKMGPMLPGDNAYVDNPFHHPMDGNNESGVEQGSNSIYLGKDGEGNDLIVWLGHCQAITLRTQQERMMGWGTVKDHKNAPPEERDEHGTPDPGDFTFLEDHRVPVPPEEMIRRLLMNPLNRPWN